MRFTLFYRGPLKSNGNTRHKHDIRRTVHAQLARLWLQRPLAEYGLLREREHTRPGEYSLLRNVAGHTFVPLVTEEMDAVAELHITLLRPEPPGSVLAGGGDIDNRLKTLFDALRMPSKPEELPVGFAPDQDERPFYCLLEDDKLVTSVSVRTEQLLEPGAEGSEVVLLIDVKTKVTRPTMSNSVLAF
jgi:hypothetical protein